MSKCLISDHIIKNMFWRKNVSMTLPLPELYFVWKSQPGIYISLFYIDFWSDIVRGHASKRMPACLSHKMKTKNKLSNTSCKVDFSRNWRIIAVAAHVFIFYTLTLRILTDFPAETNIQTIRPSAERRYSNDEENVTLNKTDDFKTILLWNTLFNDETFGLRQDSVQSTLFNIKYFGVQINYWWRFSVSTGVWEVGMPWVE